MEAIVPIVVGGVALAALGVWSWLGRRRGEGPIVADDLRDVFVWLAPAGLLPGMNFATGTGKPKLPRPKSVEKIVRFAMQVLVTLVFGGYAAKVLFDPESSSHEKEAAAALAGAIVGHWLK